MSIVQEGSDDGRCGTGIGDAVHQAICRSVAAGVTYVAAAGNDAAPVAGFTPAAYREVIAVSAITDYDGRPGGKAKPTCWDLGADDSFASYSNFGRGIDLAAPGGCILSTYPYSAYATDSGTSMAAPHVAGAAALYLATHRRASPREVRSALEALAEHGHLPGDRDHSDEGVVDVSRL